MRFFIDLLKKTYNTRLLILSATIMKNRADNIVDILNLLRCVGNENYELIEKKSIFSYGKYIDDVRIHEDGIKKIKEYSYGYVSYIRNSNKITFA